MNNQLNKSYALKRVSKSGFTISVFRSKTQDHYIQLSRKLFTGNKSKWVNMPFFKSDLDNGVLQLLETNLMQIKRILKENRCPNSDPLTSLSVSLPKPNSA